MSEVSFRSALAHRGDRNEAAGLSIRMREISDRAMIDVRGLAGDRRFLAGVQDVIGISLPKSPRTSVTPDDLAVLWISIDQGLITARRSRATPLANALREKLQASHCLITDMSDARSIFRLEGDNVREVLNKGTSVDFTSGALGAGSVRRILFAQVAAMVHVVSEGPDVMDLYVFRSYADHAWGYLLATAREGARIKLFGRQTVTPA
jgi:sarcosine oxidase subunit gamma